MIAQFKKNSYQWSPLAVALIVLLAGVSFTNAVGSKKPVSFWPKSEPGISLRRVKTGPMSDLSGPPSLDGRYLCDVEVEFGGATRLVIRDLGTGEVRPLVEVPEGFPWSPFISPNNKRIAYIHQLLPWSSPKNELHLINMDGTGHRVLYRFKEGEQFRISMWTPDGKEVLGALWKGDQDVQLAAFSIEDGSMQVIHTFDAKSYWSSGLHKLAISPNTRYVAYDRRPKEGSSARDIFILNIETQQTERVVQHPANDRLLGWTPDGNYIFFASNRRHGAPGGFGVTDTSDAYLLPISEGRPQGAPVLIKSDIPDKIRPKGFTRDGAYYYTVAFRTVEAVVARLDLQTGRLLVKPHTVGQTGADQLPAWSPDGQHLAYCVHQLNDLQIIRIRDMSTGQERQLDPNLPHFAWLRWAPDGKSLLVSNFEKKVQAIYRINASTGERVVMVQSESPDTSPRQPQLSLDGSLLYYVLFHYDSQKATLIARNIGSGDEEELFTLDGIGDMGGLIMFALSPDGRQLALRTTKETSSGPAVVSRILTMPSKGGESRELWKTNEPIILIAWTPDGRSLLFTKRVPEGGRELWLVPAGGGEARMLCSPQEMMPPGVLFGSVFRALDVHPDGQRIAYDCFEYRHEVWAMENFLPEATVAMPAHKPNFRKIRIPTKPQNGVLSPDGNKLAFISDGAVWMVPLHGKVDPDIAGEPVRLAEVPGIWDNGSLMAWSKDGEWIAVNTWPDAEDVFVYVIPAAGGEPRVVQMPKRGSHAWSYRLSLSPDGQMLAFSALELRKPRQKTSDKHDRYICTIPTAGGEPKQVSSGWGRMPSFSPDGETIAYVDGVRKNWQGTERYVLGGELWIVPSEGGTPVKLASVDGRLRGPVWSPDGKYIAVHHEPGSTNGSKEIWVFPLSPDASSVGEPEKIALPHNSSNMLAGWTPEGQLGVFLTPKAHCACYTVPASGGKAVQITPESILPYYPRWSPDGERVYFRAVDGTNVLLSYVPAAGGNIGKVPLQTERFITSVPGGGHNISPDGTKIVVSSSHDIWTIGLNDGLRTRLTNDDSHEAYPCWSPDGEWVAFVDEVNYAIYIVSAGGGEIRQVSSESDRVRGSGAITFSPDGKRIAFLSGGSIKTIPVEGGEPEVLVGKVKSGYHSQLAYSPDGSKIAHNAAGKIWITLLDGGEPQELSAGLPKDARLSEFGWSPDGEKIVFLATIGGEAEFWLIDNFLPEAVGK